MVAEFKAHVQSLMKTASNGTSVCCNLCVCVCVCVCEREWDREVKGEVEDSGILSVNRPLLETLPGY